MKSETVIARGYATNGQCQEPSYSGPTLGEVAALVARSNGWDYGYALGYVSGRDDCAHARPPEHRWDENDDYALGYHKGFSDGQTNSNL